MWLATKYLLGLLLVPPMFLADLILRVLGAVQESYWWSADAIAQHYRCYLSEKRKRSVK